MGLTNVGNIGDFAKAPASLSYIDFDPKSELKEEHGVDEFIISLPGFKKEHLRVQVSNTGILKVTGEKPENHEGTIWRRFVKETKVPENCEVNEIRAKFANSELRVTMPKKVITTPPVLNQPHQATSSALSPGQPQSEVAQMSRNDERKADQGAANGNMGSSTSRLHHQEGVEQKGDHSGIVGSKIEPNLGQVVGRVKDRMGWVIETSLGKLKGKDSSESNVGRVVDRVKDGMGQVGTSLGKVQGRESNNVGRVVDSVKDGMGRVGTSLGKLQGRESNSVGRVVDRVKDGMGRVGTSLGNKLQGRENNNVGVGVGVGVAIVAIVAIGFGAYVAYNKYGSSSYTSSNEKYA